MKLLICTQAVDLDDPILGFFHAWIEEFSKHTESVEVICLRSGRHALPHNVRVHSLGKEVGVPRTVRLWRFCKYLWTYRKDYDAVFVHMNPEYVVLAGMFWRLWSKRIGLWYAHGSVDLKLRVATTLTHDVLTASRESFRISSPKVHAIGHGIEMPRCTAGALHTPLRLTSVGRISPVKRHGLLFEVLRVLKERGTEASLTLAGAPATDADRAYEARLKSEARDQELAVLWRGPVTHDAVETILCEADIFVSCSETGSLDKAVLEAMAAGLPVVTTNDGLRSALQGVDPQALVEPNAPAIADRVAMLTALTEPERDSLRARYRSYVRDHHSLSALIKKIVTRLSGSTEST